MADLEKQGFVYLWTHKPTGVFYKGVHRGTIDDGYIGSGKRFRELFGNTSAETWKREIIFKGNFEDCLEFERQYITQEDLDNPLCLNQAFGGNVGTFGYKHTDKTKALIGDLKRGKPNEKLRGANNPRATIDKEKVDHITRLKSEGHRLTNIAKTTAVSIEQVSKITNGSIWGWHTGISHEPRPRGEKMSGEKAYNAKLTNITAIDIYKLAHETNLSLVEIGQKFDVGFRQVSKIKHGAAFSKVTGQPYRPERRGAKVVGEKNPQAKLNSKQVKKVKQLLKKKELTHGEIATRFGVTRENITSINLSRTWSSETNRIYVPEKAGVKHRGENNYNCKLTDESVLEIDKLLKFSELKLKDIAKIYDVSVGTISDIKSGKKWGWLTNRVYRPGKRGEKQRGSFHPKAKLNETQVLEIYDLSWNSQLSHSQIASRFPTSRANIGLIKNGKNWAHVTGHGKQP